MGNQTASWYIAGEGKQPAGPFTAEQLLESWRAGTVSDTTMCWREGMTQWLPLAQVEPFAALARSVPPAPRQAPQFPEVPATRESVSVMPAIPQIVQPIVAVPERKGGTFGRFFSGTMGIGCAIMLLPLVFVGGCLLMTGSCILGVSSMVPKGGKGAPKPHVNAQASEARKERCGTSPERNSVNTSNAPAATHALHMEPKRSAPVSDIPAIDENVGRLLPPGALGRRGDNPEAAPPIGKEKPQGSALTLQDKLRQHMATINTSTAVYAAVNNKEVKIIEIVDTCTSDQFDAEQTKLLAKWVQDGGVLWANNNVLLMLGLRYSRFWGEGGDRLSFVSSTPNCAPATGDFPIVANCKNIRLKRGNGKVHTLSYPGVVPLLRLAEQQPFPFDVTPVGTTLWSIVPYGKGAISDVKPVDMNYEDGALFWQRFCQFCLREIEWPENFRAPGGREGSGDTKGLLTGIWRASAGAVFTVVDDGKCVTVELMESNVLDYLSGKLARNEQKPGKKNLTGLFEVRLLVNRQRLHKVHVEAKIDDANRLLLHCRDWPVCNVQRYLGTRALDEIWTRSSAIGGARSQKTDSAEPTQGVPNERIE